MDKKVKAEHPMAGDRSAYKGNSRMGEVFEKLEEVKNESQPETPKEEYKMPSDLKDLIVFGKVSEEVSIGGYNILISTLNAKQQRKLVSELMKLSSEDRIFYIKIYTLSEAIVSINNVPMNEISSDASIEDSFQRKVEVISNFQSTLIEALFNKYESMNNISKEYFKTNIGEQIKK